MILVTGAPPGPKQGVRRQGQVVQARLITICTSVRENGSNTQVGNIKNEDSLKFFFLHNLKETSGILPHCGF